MDRNPRHIETQDNVIVVDFDSAVPRTLRRTFDNPTTIEEHLAKIAAQYDRRRSHPAVQHKIRQPVVFDDSDWD